MFNYNIRTKNKIGVAMKKYLIKILSFFLILSTLFIITVSAENGEGWFIIKHGNKTPDFPKSCEYLDNNNCYYLDKNASEKDDKTVYLTFDVGYENGNVSKIVDILNKNKVKGAFFILDNIVKKNPDLMRALIEGGHTICNHTKNHKNLTKLADEEIAQNLKALEIMVEEKYGYTMPKYFRYPEGYYNEHTVKLLSSLGYKTFFWSLAYADWDNCKQPSEEYAMNILLGNIHPGAVLLLHPTSETNVKILDKFIKELKSQGYHFEEISCLVST